MIVIKTIQIIILKGSDKLKGNFTSTCFHPRGFITNPATSATRKFKIFPLINCVTATYRDNKERKIPIISEIPIFVFVVFLLAALAINKIITYV